MLKLILSSSFYRTCISIIRISKPNTRSLIPAPRIADNISRHPHETYRYKVPDNMASLGILIKTKSTNKSIVQN